MSEQAELHEPFLSSEDRISVFSKSILGFYWSPWWKGILWLACYLATAALFIWLQDIAEAYTSNRISFTARILLDSNIWVSAYLAWRSLHLGKVGDNLEHRRCNLFWPLYLTIAFSLLALVAVSDFICSMAYLYNHRELITIFGSWRQAFVVVSITWPPNAVAMCISLPLFSLIFAHRQKPGLAGIILPSLFTIALLSISFYLSVHAIILLGTRLGIPLPAVSPQYRVEIVRLALVSIVMCVIGYFAVRRFRVTV